jgi:hypothetical protein
MSNSSELEDELFYEALCLTDPVLRRKYLDDVCAGNPTLRARLEKLLAMQSDAEQFFVQAELAIRPQKGAQ